MARYSRRFPRFRLRTLLLVITLSAFGLGFHHIYVRPYLRQHEAGLALSAKGATLEWRSAEPAWLMALPRVFLDDVVLRDCVTVQAEHAGLRDSDLAYLRQMPRLQRLYLAGNPIGDQGLKHLRGLQCLERLSLWGTDITDDGLRHVGRLRALTVLDIHSGDYRLGSQSTRRLLSLVFIPRAFPRAVKDRLTGQCLKHLRDATNLRAIYFSFPLDDEALAHLAAFPRLRIRTLVIRDVTSAGFSVMPRFPDLETVVVERSSIGSGNLWYLTRLPNLHWLQLEGVQAAQSDFRPLRGLTRLEELSLAISAIGDRGLENLSQLSQLQKLSLRSTGITDRGVAHLADLTNLRVLDLRDTLVTADSLNNLPAMRQLESLGLATPLDDEAVGWLARLPNLMSLVGSKSNTSFDFFLTDAGAANLAKLRCFKHAYLNVNDAIAGSKLEGIDVPTGSGTITDTGLAHLLETPCFRMLSLSGRDITASGLRWSPELSDCRYIQLKSPRPASEVITRTLAVGAGSASLGSGGLRVEAGKDLGPRSVNFVYKPDGCQLDLLRYLPTIKRLKLAHRISPGSDWDNLRFVSGLEEFEMPGFRATGLLVDAVAIRRLGEMQDLRRLACDLPDGISPEELAPLGRLKNLEYLDLHCSPLNAEHLHILSQLRSLKTLRIFGTPRSLDDSRDLHHLTDLTQLTKLWLYGVKDAGMPFLGEMKSLVRLSLKSHHISDKAFKHLEDLPALEYLDARAGRWMTRAQLKALAQRLPNVHVRTDG